MDAEAAERIRLSLGQQLDWNYVLRKAEEHFITPLVYRSLNSTLPNAVPKEILHGLGSYFLAHARRNLFFTRELLNLLKVMEENGIRAVAYKGPLLSASAYGNVALRSFIDLDILVHERDILLAKELLIARGYEMRTQLTRAEEEAHLRSRKQKDIVLIRQDMAVSVELHWGIASLFLFPLDSGLLWERLETITLGGATVSNLRSEDMLLILCVHGAKHSFKRLQWICDIAELIRANPEMDWNQVTGQAAKLGSKRMLSLGLFLATNLLAAVVPQDVARSIDADPKVKSLASRVMTSLFSDTTNLSHVFTDITFRVNLREEWRDRTRLRLHHYLHKLSLAVTPNVQDRELLPLPAVLSFLYYLVRPVRLAHVYGLALLMQLIREWKR